MGSGPNKTHRAASPVSAASTRRGGAIGDPEENPELGEINTIKIK